MRWLCSALAALLLVTAGCSAAGETNGSKGDTTTLTVLAAASLTNAFGDVRSAYQKTYPGVRLRFSFAGSQTLAAQVREGAPADVIATADQPTMAGLEKYVRGAKPYATNRLAIVVQKGNPRQIRRLSDLARPGVSVILAGPTVPAGRYARQVLHGAGVRVHPKSEPTDVRQVLTPVRLGEADAGIVYATDISDAGGPDVQAVTIPAGQNVIATYPVATIRGSQHARAATAFATWLRSAPARRILRAHGFGVPHHG